MTINDSPFQMRIDTQFQAFKPNITFQMVFFSSVRGQRSEKISTKKTKKYVPLIEQFLQKT